MSCSNVFTDYISNCQESITVNTRLDPGFEYKWVITDKFGKEYSGRVTAGDEGELTIAVTDLPAGLLTQYSGEFKFEVFQIQGIYGEVQCQKVLLPLSKYYDSIHFEVKGGTNEKSNIGCAL